MKAFWMLTDGQYIFDDLRRLTASRWWGALPPVADAPPPGIFLNMESKGAGDGMAAGLLRRIK